MSWSIYCMQCTRYLQDGCCTAFPDGIPKEIRRGRVCHDKPYPGDHGIVYEEAPEFKRIERPRRRRRRSGLL